ncbi:lipid-binding protein [Arcticibacter sp.]|jgi:hypothetical protein|uniref:lipid-binding protein n=1 Tax=Arcticibacter sp. TaxID=1872630 RepID=UPI003890A060
MKNIRYILLALIVSVLYSCETYSDQEQEHTAIGKMSGEWLSNVYEDDDSTLAVNGLFALRTYNTTSNDVNKAWMKLGSTQIVALLGKVDVDVAQRTFSGTTIANEAKAGNTFTILEAKVMLDAATTETGIKADSIYVRYTTSVNNKTYIVRGHRTTQWTQFE